MDQAKRDSTLHLGRPCGAEGSAVKCKVKAKKEELGKKKLIFFILLSSFHRGFTGRDWDRGGCDGR